MISGAALMQKKATINTGAIITAVINATAALTGHSAAWHRCSGETPVTGNGCRLPMADPQVANYKFFAREISDVVRSGATIKMMSLYVPL